MREKKQGPKPSYLVTVDCENSPIFTDEFVLQGTGNLSKKAIATSFGLDGKLFSLFCAYSWFPPDALW